MAVKTLKPARTKRDSFSVRVTDKWSGSEQTCKAELTAHKYHSGEIRANLVAKTPLGQKVQEFYYSGAKWQGLGDYSDRECSWHLPMPVQAVLAEMAG